MAEADFNGIENEVSLYIERADYEGLIVRFIYFNYFSIQTKFNMTSAIVDCFQLYKLNGWYLYTLIYLPIPERDII